MKNKNILALCVAVPLFIACTPANAVNIPIIGMGGIASAEDALEFIMAGATMVAVGTANFNDPMTTIKVIEGIQSFMEKNGIKDIAEITGCVK